MSEGTRVEELLEDRPELESALSEILAVDRETDTWTFDDVPVDSGSFGELVSRGIVEKEDGEYRLSRDEQVRAVLAGEDAVAADEPVTDEAATDAGIDVSLPSVDAGVVGLLAGVLGLVVVARSFVVGSVFRGGDVVLSANDPYFYRYHVEQLLTGGSSGGLSEPLTVELLAGVSGLLGGVDATGVVLALYPVATAVLTAALVYWMAVRLTADRRVGLAAVVVLAVTPGHALRTALGFADHHAFDYLWLAVTAAALVAVTAVDTRERLTDRGTVLAVLGLGVGIGAQILAWEKGPLHLFPIAAVVAIRTLLDLSEDRSPLVTNAPLIAGLAVGALLTLVGHLLTGWHSTFVAATPLVLTAGAVAVVAVGVLTRRLGRSARELAAVFAAGGVLALAGVWLLAPALRTQLVEGLGLVTRTDDIAEANALFSGDTFGFLLLFGFFLFLAVPALAWASRHVSGRRAPWLVVCTYGWFFFALSLFQVRFVGQLALFTAIFAGLAFVWLAARVDLAGPLAVFDSERDLSDWTPRRPDASTVAAVLALFVLIGGIGVLQTAIKVEQITTDEASYETAAYLSGYADQRGWETRQDAYVFSNWGRNRMFNYFANGDAGSYADARREYPGFISEGNPDFAVGVLPTPVRFVVTEDREADPRTMQARLHDHLGSRTDGVAGLGRFRAIYSTENGERRAFLFVPGATVRGTTSPNATVTASTPVDVPGAGFTYERQTAANATGAYGVTVAHPGTYEVTTGDETRTVTVPETAVMNGTAVRVAG